MLQETLSAWVMVILVPPQLVELDKKTRVPGEPIRRFNHGVWRLPVSQSGGRGHQLERRTRWIDLTGGSVGQRVLRVGRRPSYALPASSMSWLAMSFGS